MFKISKYSRLLRDSNNSPMHIDCLSKILILRKVNGSIVDVRMNDFRFSLAKKLKEHCTSFLKELIFLYSCTSLVITFTTNIYKRYYAHNDSTLRRFLPFFVSRLSASPVRIWHGDGATTMPGIRSSMTELPYIHVSATSLTII